MKRYDIVVKYQQYMVFSTMFCWLVLLCSCNTSSAPSPRENAREMLMDEIRVRVQRDTPEHTMRYVRPLVLLDSYSKNNAIPPTPVMVEFHERAKEKDMPTKHIWIQWLESGNDVIGFFLIINGNTYDYKVLDPDSEEMRRQAGCTEFRLNIVSILEAGKEERGDYKELHESQKSDAPSVSLTPEVLGTIYAQHDAELSKIRFGLILRNGKRSETISPRVFVHESKRKPATTKSTAKE